MTDRRHPERLSVEQLAAQMPPEKDETPTAWWNRVKDSVVALTRDEAKNTVIYQRASDEAAKQNKPLVVHNGEPAAPANAIRLTREEARDHQTYKAARARAEAAGTVVVVED